MPARTYDDIAPHYDAAIGPLDRWFLARLRATTLRYLPDDARILEIGAGTGRNFVYYPTKTFSVASEPSREMLKIASEKKRGDAVRLVQSCAEQLPFADNCFDAAFATLVFCSLARPAEAFTELRRVVKSGGTVILLEHVRPVGLLGPVFDLLNLVTVPLFDDHFNRRTAAEAQTNGLQLLKVERSLLGIINLISCEAAQYSCMAGSRRKTMMKYPLLLLLLMTTICTGQSPPMQTEPAAKIETTYDSIKDRTMIRLAPVQISGEKDMYHSLHMTPSFSFPGHQLQSPSRIDFELQTVVKRILLDSDLYVVFIVDGETIFLSSSNRRAIPRPVPGRRWIGEQLIFNMPYPTFVKITKAKEFAIKFDAVKFDVGETQLQTLREFAKEMN